MKVHRISKVVVISFIPAIIILFVTFKSSERSHQLSFVPKALKVSKIIYAKEAAVGFGPSGHESGVISYELSEEAVSEIKKDGIKFFLDISENKKSNDDWRGQYEEWEETPLLSESSWRETPIDRMDAPYPQVENYLNHYKSGVEIEPNIGAEINSIVAKRGSYFAKGRTGIIIVAPEAKKVFYTYSR